MISEPATIPQSDSRRRRLRVSESKAARERSGRLLNLRDLGGRHRDLRLYAAPPDRASLDGLLERAEQHYIHHLPIIEALEDEWREQRPVFVSFKSKSNDAGEEVDQHKKSEKDQ